LRAGAFAALLAAALSGCTKSEPPKVDAAAERAQATERAKNDVFGAQVKAVEDAKKTQEDLNKKAQENVDSIEKAAK
jgi:outer membrane lipoprotein-sorting protein